MKFLLIVSMVALIGVAFGVNHANAICVIDTDWPSKPCIDTFPPLPLSKSEWRDLWTEYYNIKGQVWMEQQKIELDKQIKSGTLQEWIESGYATMNFQNYNVWFYYYVNDKAPAPEGYELDDSSFHPQTPTPLKQIKNSIPIEEIQCKEGLKLIKKLSDNSPACVKSLSIQKLMKRGWTDSITFITNLDNSSNRTITLADNDKVISMKKGERFLLKMSDEYGWNVEIDNQKVVSRVTNITVIKGAQGVYKAHELGNAVMTTTGNPICLTAKPCMQPSKLLIWNIQVIE